MLKQLGFCCVLLATAVFTHVYAQEPPTHQLPPVTVQGQPESQERVGPYQVGHEEAEAAAPVSTRNR